MEAGGVEPHYCWFRWSATAHNGRKNNVLAVFSFALRSYGWLRLRHFRDTSPVVWLFLNIAMLLNLLRDSFRVVSFVLHSPEPAFVAVCAFKLFFLSPFC